jgi:hypothetical protein
MVYQNSKPRGSCYFHLGFNSNHGVQTMAKADAKNTTRPTAFLNTVARIHLSHHFRDLFVAAAFKAAEDEGIAPGLVEVDKPGKLSGFFLPNALVTI